MPQYASVSGTILQINYPENISTQNHCGLQITLPSTNQGIVNLTLTGSTYVLNSSLLKVGDLVTCFYSLLAPVPLIYPPLYQALVVAPTPSGTYAALDIFTWLPSSQQLTNSDNTLRLNHINQTRALLPNGQPFVGNLSDKLLLVLYRATTRSIPAQTVPNEIVVFCQEPI